MPRKIIYLINPIAGTRGKTSLTELIARKTQKAGIEFDIMSTNAEGDYGDLKQRISREQITDIVICGGDGTVNTVCSSLIGIPVNLGIVPMGSGNGLALAAKIPLRPDKALDLIIEGKASFIDGFQINDHFSCMLCGIGYDAAVAHEFARQKKRGLKSYIKVGTIHFFKTKPYPFEITVENKTFQVEAFFISIANGNQFGNHVTIAPKASLRDGLLDIVIVKKMSKWLLPFSVIRQVLGFNALQPAGGSAGKKQVAYFQTAALRILNTMHAPLHVDGDPKPTAACFDIRVIPGAMKLIRPEV